MCVRVRATARTLGEREVAARGGRRCRDLDRVQPTVAYTTCASTLSTDGRSRTIGVHESPSSAEP